MRSTVLVKMFATLINLLEWNGFPVINRTSTYGKFVILDRDGVINHDSDAYIKSSDEWLPIPGSLDAIARLHHAGYGILVATNQSGLSRGLFNIDHLNSMHRKMQRELSVHGAQVEAVFFCPHLPEAYCRCRKPLPGLLEDISSRLQINLEGTPFIGDSISDIQAASSAGARPILVRTGKGERTIANHGLELVDVPIYADLARAADALLTV